MPMSNGCPDFGPLPHSLTESLRVVLPRITQHTSESHNITATASTAAPFTSEVGLFGVTGRQAWQCQIVSSGNSPPSLPFSVIPIVAIRQTESDPVSFADGGQEERRSQGVSEAGFLFLGDKMESPK